MSVQRFVLGPGQRERVDKILARKCEGTSRAAVQRWIDEGRVRVDGQPCRARDLVGEGAEIEFEPLPPPRSEASPDESVLFTVLYEDDALLVVDKPAGLVVHPARGHRSGTLVNGLLARDSFRALPADPADPTGSVRPGIVHRIDKDTSGVLVIAKTEIAREGLKEQLAAHSVERCYQAITIGVPRPGVIKTLYGRDPRSRLRFTSRVATGKSAVTHVSVLERLAGGRAALVECRLETGRTHQIRVHLCEQTRTPLLGDPLYKSTRAVPELEPIAGELGRQALHARVLGFIHPETRAPLRFESALPKDFQRALDALRALPA